MKKWITLTILILILIVSAWTVFMFVRVANQQLDASNRGHLYRHFFIILEEFTQEHGVFPSSLDILIEFESEIEHEGVTWPGFAELVEEHITPNFDIDPLVDSLDTFAPDYKTRADWGDVHCESLWEQIVEQLNSIP